MTHELPKLIYDAGGLEPVISRRTIEFHYGKHHQAYVTNLNNLIKGTEFENVSLEEIIKKSVGAIFNNAAQIWNHTFYFETFTKADTSAPSDKLKEFFATHFSSFEKFKEDFTKASATLFGSGWAWLVINENGKAEIIQASNAGTPVTGNNKPVLTFDVWEHAYYLDYQNKRADYIETLWRIVDWVKVENRIF